MKQFKEEPVKDFTDSWWFFILCAAVSGFIGVFVI